MMIMFDDDYEKNLDTLHNLTYRTKAECAMVPVSLDPEGNMNETLSIFVKRLKFNPNQNAPRAMYMLSGGPGMASNIFDSEMDLLVKMFNGQFDMYVVDHRGVGRSNRVTCTTTQAETLGSDEGITISLKEWTKNGCAQSFANEWSGSAHHFSSKAAAIDVVKIIKQINIPQGQKTFVFGASYGSVWVSRIIRYLQLNNLNNNQELISGFIMDGIVNVIGKPAPAGTTGFKFGRETLDSWDENFNGVGNAMMELCAGNRYNMSAYQFVKEGADDTFESPVYNFDNICKEKIGKKANGDPVTYMKNVIESVYVNNTCRPISEAIPLLQLKAIFGAFIESAYQRVMIPAFIYRLDRCDEDIDIPYILHIRDIMVNAFSRPLKSLPLASPIIQSHIAYSELWNPATTIEFLEKEFNSSAIYIGSGAVDMATLLKISDWPVYDLDAQYFEQPYTPSAPLLMLNGNLDPNTPLWSALSQNASIQGDLHDLIIVPFSAHGVIVGPTFANTSMPVGLQLVVNFAGMEKPNVFTMDRSCVQQIQFNFSGSTFYNQAFFGSYNLYEDTYIGSSSERYVSVYLMVGVFIGILLVAVIIINTIVYFIIKIRDQQKAKKEMLVYSTTEPASTVEEFSPYQNN